jgi:hypothetical protein
MLTPVGCKQQAAEQPMPLMLKAKAKTIFLNFKNFKKCKQKK